MKRPLLLSLFALAAACAIDDPPSAYGKPCSVTADCEGGFSCLATPGASPVCVPIPEQDPVVGCEGAADGDGCSDGDACTEDDRCQGGACVGTQKDCAPGVCSQGLCTEPPACQELAGDRRVTSVSGDTDQPDVAYHEARDELGVVYQDDREGQREVYFTRVAADGGVVGSELRLTFGDPPTADDPAIGSSAPSIVYNPSAQEYGVAWQRGDLFTLLDNGVYFQRVSGDGATASAPEQLDGISVYEVSGPDVAWSGSEYAVLWDDGRDDAGFSLYFRRVTAEGDRTGELRPVTDPGLTGYAGVDMTFAHGVYGACFQDDGEAWFLRLSTAGAPLSLERVSAAGAGVAGATVAAAPDGFACAWMTTDRVRFAAVDTSGAPTGGVVDVANAQTPGLPRLARLPAGFALLYSALRPDDDARRDVVLVRLADDGTPSGAPSFLTDSGGYAASPAVVATAGGVSTVFVDERDGNRELYFDRVCP